MVQIKWTCRHFQLFQSLKSSFLKIYNLPKFAHFEKQILFLEHPVMYSLLSRYISCHTCLNKRNSKSFRKFLELRVAFTKFRHFYLTKIQKIWNFFFVFFLNTLYGISGLSDIVLGRIDQMEKVPVNFDFLGVQGSLNKMVIFLQFLPISNVFWYLWVPNLPEVCWLGPYFFFNFFLAKSVI